MREHLADVPLAEVDRVLSGLWGRATSGGEEGSTFRMRGLNLVVLCFAGTSVEPVIHTLRELSGRSPARMILVTEEAGSRALASKGSTAKADPPESAEPRERTPFQDPTDGEDPAESRDPTVQAHILFECGGESTDRVHACFELVQIDAQRKDMEQIEGLLAPVLIVGLPTVVWVPRGDEGVLRVLKAVADAVDHIITDSAGFPDPVTGVVELQRLTEVLPGRVVLSDLSWTRLTPWREMIAELFEVRERRSMLGRIERVLVTYGSEATMPGAGYADWRPAAARSLLLVAWLASRLGWQPRPEGWAVEGDALVTRFDRLGGRSDGGTLRVELQPHRCRPGTFGGVESVTLEIARSSSGEEEAVLTFTRSPESGVCAARVRRSGADDQVRTLEVPLPGEADLLSEELSYHGRDGVFREALAMAAGLAALSGSAGLGE
jgi:glucose-6-phosphate dehydrogenase assembly protein OpcA